MNFLILMLVTQTAPAPTKICDVNANSRCETVTTVSGKNGGDTNVIGGSLTCNAGTNLNTSLLALDSTLTSGAQKAIARGAAKGATTAADVTATANGADHTGLDVQLQNPTVAVTQSGTWSDRVVGSAGGAFDAVNNAVAPANVLADGAETAAMGTTQPTASTTGNIRRILSATDGVLYARPHGPVNWSCFVQGVTATTQCRAAPASGLRAYTMSVTCDNQAATVQGVDVVFGTGTNCGTGTTALTHKFQMGTNATTTSPDHVTAYFPAPLVPTAANAICVRPTAASAFGCTLSGYDAP